MSHRCCWFRNQGGVCRRSPGEHPPPGVGQLLSLRSLRSAPGCCWVHVPPYQLRSACPRTFAPQPWPVVLWKTLLVTARPGAGALKTACTRWKAKVKNDKTTKMEFFSFFWCSGRCFWCWFCVVLGYSIKHVIKMGVLCG